MRRFLTPLHWLFLAIVYGFLAAKAFLELNLDFDYTWYHLPEALRFFGLTSFVPTEYIRIILAGYPPLAHWLQGALIAASGRFSFGNSLGMIGLLLHLGVVHLLYRDLRFLRWYMSALLAIPFLVRNTYSGYLDLWVASMMASAFAFRSRLASSKTAGDIQKFAIGCVACMALGVFSRMQAWPIAGALGAILAVDLLLLSRGKIASYRQSATIVAVYAAVFLAWPVRNYVVLGNPTYPIPPPFVQTELPGLSRAFMRLENQGCTPDAFLQSSNLTRFVFSAFELTRLTTREPLTWSLGQGHGTSASPHDRMGGWFMATQLLGWALLLLGLARGKIRPAEFAAVLLVWLVVAVLPQSHELRYWSALPLILLVPAVRFISAEKDWTAHLSKALLILLPLFVLSRLYWQITYLSRTHFEPFQVASYIKTGPIENFASDDVIRFWKERASDSNSPKPACVGGPPEALFYAGPTLREYAVQPCWKPSHSLEVVAKQ